METVKFLDNIGNGVTLDTVTSFTEEIRNKFIELNIPVNHETNSDIQRINEPKDGESK